MAGLEALISPLLNLVENLLLEVKNTFFKPSSSSSVHTHDALAVEADLKGLMRLLQRIKATLYDAEERNIRDKSVQLWLKEIRELAHDAEYILDEYMYEVYRAKVEARNTSELNNIKEHPEANGVCGVQIPDSMADHIRKIRNKFEEIAKDREALHLGEEDAPRRYAIDRRRHTPTSPLIMESIFGREEEKEQVLNLFFMDQRQGKIFSVLPLVGKGGLGKTTVARLVYNDKRVKDCFDLIGWVYVSDDFNIERITRDIIESFTREACDLKNPSVLMEEFAKVIIGKKVFLVLDDVWNEEPSLWESLRLALMLARMATILVTTRNISVARIMQTIDPLHLAYLSDDKCWLLFTHYAFQGVDPAKRTRLEEVGKEIVKKCGRLPLAVKSIASLLSHEAELQSWIEILQSHMWELDSRNEILAPLQISYERMPTYLKPCLLLCSMFPKKYKYEMDLMSKLWIAHSYIEPKGQKTIEEVAVGYAYELYERSFFDDFNVIYENGLPYKTTFRVHDMVHDIAWLKSEKTCHSVEQGKQDFISREVRHLYLNKELKGVSELLGSIHISVLETLVMRHPISNSYWISIINDDDDKKPINLSGLTEAKDLRALDLKCEREVQQFALGNLKHLRYLSLHGKFVSQISPQSIFSCYSLRILILDLSWYHMELEGIGNLINLEFLQLWLWGAHIKLPGSLCFLRKLRVLEIHESELIELPECIGDLSELKKIVIKSYYLRKLPDSFCKLTNLKELIFQKCNYLEELPQDIGNLTRLQFLFLDSMSMHYLPSSCTKLFASCKMNVQCLCAEPDSHYGAVRWLKDFNDLKGVLMINNIKRITRLEDAQNANLISKHNLETLLLDWFDKHSKYAPRWGLPKGYSIENGIFLISIKYSEKYKSLDGQDLQILEAFQPHPNLKNLHIDSYGGSVFPRWMGDPLSFASLVKLCIKSCFHISHLSIGNLLSLKLLHIAYCDRLLLLRRESLPSQLEHLIIRECKSLVEVALLESLVELNISSCNKLKSFSTAEWQMTETASKSSDLEVIPSNDSHFKLPKELKIFPLRKITLKDCSNLIIGENQLLPGEGCELHIYNCCNLKEWLLQHDLKYVSSDDGSSGDDEELLFDDSDESMESDNNS
ncbi:Disease resistance protein (CC-NBS-LRR class) family [Rhynchospora pubera]|uniref:Disease resistance protein (CC-NBS-LRR class) family n=1 Tax=Rhynchospora pubera TaxID=906938 RepID=A0AAV8EPR6_9POAL|nr:Disease resistance protein (CC-NBS-LRR class) family [Rhynchospora pubera]